MPVPNQAPPRVSIIIPARNEEERLPASLHALFKWLNTCPRSAEVLVVVEPGTDSTAEVARSAFPNEPRLTVIENTEQRGKGFAVRTGMLRATGTEARLFTDADLSVPPRFIDTFCDFLETHPDIDILIGSRQHAESAIVKYQPAARRLAGRAFNGSLKALGLTRFSDTQCGFKVFRPHAAEALFSRSRIDGFAFDAEILHLAERLGFTVEELPVEWTNSNESTVNLPRHGWTALRDVLRIRSLHRESVATSDTNP